MTTIRRLIGRVTQVASSSVAQAIQSLSSMIVLMLAAKLLGIEALGLFSILYGALILAAAITTGFVGDTLMVLDRHDPNIQAGLRFWFVLLSLGLGIVAVLISWAQTELSIVGATIYGLVAIAYVAEELTRRSYMAILDFPRLIVVDLVVLVTTSSILLGMALVQTLTIEIFLVAVLGGQVVGTLYGWLRLPRSEKVSAQRPARIKMVADFGIWRSALQGLRPAQLTVTRFLVIALIGLVAAGQLEAARLYAAPAMLVVSGTCSFLFASLARQRDQAPLQQLHQTDRSVLKLFLATLGCAVIGMSLLPWGGPLLTGMIPSALAVTGWLAYASAVAVSTPYGLLAAVYEKARTVFVIRLADSILSVLLVLLVLSLTDDYRLVPWAAALGAVAGGLTVRRWLIHEIRTEEKVLANLSS
ncbi:hypothetical protein [Glutamicibacter sp. JC586]|uniref:hypothetical protein n=1 Tax=Glutamicibacter sp. JC586 TaxID=2590552 RepID=UPI001357BF12|nr:hypothetical protein [Glutamicibacter sp. JC586]